MSIAARFWREFPEFYKTNIRLCHLKPESIAKIEQMLQAFKEGRRERLVYET
jgi:hypothetical protein